MESNLHPAPLDTEHFDEHRRLPDRLLELESANFPVDVMGEYNVLSRKNGEADTTYNVYQVRTSSKRKDDPDRDIVADQLVMWVCHCADFHHRRAPDPLADEPERPHPGHAENCKHVDAVAAQRQEMLA